MSFARYAVGVVALAVVAAAVILPAVRVRRRFLPTFTGPVARLAETTVALALLFFVLHGVGAIGLFRRGWIVLAAVVVGTGAWTLAGRVAGESDAALDAAVEPRLPSPPKWSMWACGAAIALVAVQWTSWTLSRLAIGITDTDSLAYHLPFAARWVQEGWITRLHPVYPEFPHMLHPGDSELLHALGMAMFDSDFLSPLMNMGWLALVLLAAWCFGRPYGYAPTTTIATAALMSTFLMGPVQAGAAVNDAASIGLLLVAAALVVQRDGGRAAIAVAGAAAGIALGTKLTLLAPVAGMTIAIPIAFRDARVRHLVTWSLPLLVTGSFWYLRNLFRTGSPLSSLDLSIGPVGFPHARFELIDKAGYSVADYLTDEHVWREYFVPGLNVGLTGLWPLLLAVVAVGLLGVLRLGDRRARIVAVGGVASLAAYVVQPASAQGLEGMPLLFAANLRYGYGGVALGLALVTALPAIRSSRIHVVFAGATGIVLMAALADHGFSRPWLGRAVLLTGLVTAGLAALVYARRRGPDWALPALLAAAVLVAGVGGYLGARRYLDLRYRDIPHYAWAANVRDAKIASLSLKGYPYYGPAWANHVDYPGLLGKHGDFHNIQSCVEWRTLLRDGHYTIVVYDVPLLGIDDHPDETWTSTDPAAKPFLKAGSITVYAIDGTLDPATCPP